MDARQHQAPQTSPAVVLPEQASQSQQQDIAALEDSRLRSVWEREMKERAGPRVRHRNAAVLMISWATSLDTLGTAAEVDALGAVFSEKFNYTVLKNQIEDNGKFAQIQVSKFLAEFVYNHDGEDSLLIIYYAGHGEGGEPGQLTLRSSNRAEEIPKGNLILWHEAESIVKQTKSDVLVIFDCCFAGNLVRSRSMHRNFEFLGATGDTATTPIPGPSSFTTALIWSLEKLATLDKPFSTTELLNLIGLEAPNFPQNQFPILKPCHGLRDRRLMLAKIPKEGDCVHNTQVDSEHELPGNFFDLRFYCQKIPSPEDLTTLAKGLKELMDEQTIHATRVGWVGLQSRDIVRKAAGHWRNVMKSRKLEPNSPLLSPQQAYPITPVTEFHRSENVTERNVAPPLSMGYLASHGAYYHLWGLLICFTDSISKFLRRSGELIHKLRRHLRNGMINHGSVISGR